MTHSDAQYKKMTETPVAALVVTLGIPTTISMLVTNIYNMADTAFVGTLGTSASGAIGVVFGYMAILQAVGFMFGQGSGIQIARLLGQRNREAANRVASTGFFSALLLGLLVAIGSFIALDPLLRFLGSSETILPFAREYCFYILLGAPFIVGSFVLNNILRYEGLAMKAMIGLVAGAVLNIAGDALLIFVFHMGTAGAGLSTALSQIASFFILLHMFLSGVTQSKLSLHFVSRDLRILLRILAMGFPSLLRQAMGSLGTILLNRCARGYGDAAVAAMAIVNRVAMFIFAVGLGLGQGYQPVCGFNYGAGLYGRVKEGYFFCVKYGTIILTGASALCLAFAPQIISFFRDDPEVIAVGTVALRAQAISLPLMATIVITNMMLQSTGKGLKASIASSARNGIFFIPMILILPRLFGLFGVEISQACADVLSFLLAIPFAASELKKM